MLLRRRTRREIHIIICMHTTYMQINRCTQLTISTRWQKKKTTRDRANTNAVRL